MKAVNRIGAVVAAAAALLALTSTTTQATPDRSAESTVDALVAANPGARQMSANTVRLANGVEVEAAVRPCRNYELCLYDSHNYSVSGNQLIFRNCGFVNIGAQYGWSDKIRSYHNFQTTGTVSIFMNWTGSRWEEVERSTARQSKPYVDNAYYADGVWVC